MTTDPLLGNVGFIGAGALGTTLAQAMHRCGYRVRAVASRTAASAERLAAAIPGCEAASPQEVADRCDTVFLTVPDDAIATSLRPPMARRAGGRPLLRGAPPRRAVGRRPVGRRCHRGGRHWRRDAPAADLHGRRRCHRGLPGRCLRHRSAGALARGVGRPCGAARRVADLAVVRGPGALPRQRHRRVRPHRHAAEAGRRPLERHSRAGGAGDASPAAADPQHAQQHRAAGVAGGADRPRGPRRRWRRADAPRRPVGAGAWLLAAVRSPVAGVASDRPGEGDARRTAGSAAARAAVGLHCQANTQHEGAPCV